MKQHTLVNRARLQMTDVSWPVSTAPPGMEGNARRRRLPRWLQQLGGHGANFKHAFLAAASLSATASFPVYSFSARLPFHSSKYKSVGNARLDKYFWISFDRSYCDQCC